MAAELLEKITPERCWEITAKILSALMVLRGEKSVAPLMGKGEGVFAPVMGAEKWQEIHEKIFGDGGENLCLWVKETFNIPVEEINGAINVIEVASRLQQGPEQEWEYAEKTPERAICRTTRCTWMERYKDYEVDYTLIPCVRGCPAWFERAFKAINPKLNYKATKQMPRGDPYCEHIYEFKNE